MAPLIDQQIKVLQMPEKTDEEIVKEAIKNEIKNASISNIVDSNHSQNHKVLAGQIQSGLAALNDSGKIGSSAGQTLSAGAGVGISYDNLGAWDTGLHVATVINLGHYMTNENITLLKRLNVIPKDCDDVPLDDFIAGLLAKLQEQEKMVTKVKLMEHKLSLLAEKFSDCSFLKNEEEQM